MLFDNRNLTGDQKGGLPLYPAVGVYPDGVVDGDDVSFVTSKWGSWEDQPPGTQPPWNYMADVCPDRVIDGTDVLEVTRNYGRWGSYVDLNATDLTAFTIIFNTGEGAVAAAPDSLGIVVIPWEAWGRSFTVELNGTPWGAMIVFWKP